MPQHTGKQVTESFKFQTFLGEHTLGSSLEGHIAEQHAMLATQPQFTSATNSVQIRHLLHFLVTTLSLEAQFAFYLLEQPLQVQ